MVLTNGQLPLYASGSSGNQQVYGVIVVGGEEVEPFIFLDFVDEIYQQEGENIALATALIENEDWGAWSPGTKIINGTGLTGGSGSSPVLTGDAFTLAAAGATMVLEFAITGTASATRMRYEMVDDLIDYNTYYGSSFANQNESAAEGTIYDNLNQVDDGKLPNGAHRTAFTMIAGKITRSTDGAAVIQIDPAEPWTPAPTVMGFVVGPDFVVKSIGIYPAQDDAELPSLSAP